MLITGYAHKSNNFDLIRLFAALSVVASHMSQHGIITHIPTQQVINWLWALLPGVQIFFIVSGFLITSSWLRTPDFKRYFKARALRILPALFLSTCVTTGLLVAFGFHAKIGQWVPWFLGQVSTLYVYHTPHSLAGFSGDMPNASVWTLPVEVQFYCVLPFILWAGFKKRWYILAGLMALSSFMLMFNDFGIHLAHPDPRHTIWHHFWWFGMGIMAALEWDTLRKWFEGRFWAWLAVHLVVFTALPVGLVSGYLEAITLTGVVLSAAFTAPHLSAVLRHNDFSYGVYLFHRPYIHALVLCGITGIAGSILTAVLTFATAFLSWKLIEKPALRWK